MPRALVLVSGGLDSAVAYAWAIREGYEPVALTFRYPGRPQAEVEATLDLLSWAARTEHVEVDLPFLREATDLDPAFADAPEGYIPGRNALFYATAFFHAQALGCDIVVGGHNADDAQLFPDVGGAFFDELQRLLARGLWLPAGVSPPRLVMPLLPLGREEVVALGRSLRVPLERTWSCYEDAEVPCRRCPACARRGAVTVVARARRPAGRA